MITNKHSPTDKLITAINSGYKIININYLTITITQSVLTEIIQSLTSYKSTPILKWIIRYIFENNMSTQTTIISE